MIAGELGHETGHVVEDHGLKLFLEHLSKEYGGEPLQRLPTHPSHADRAEAIEVFTEGL